MKDALRHAVRIVALLNLAYFGVEFGVAFLIGSVSLFADSIDFLEDASINTLILLALAWSAPRRALVGKVLAGIIMIPGLATSGWRGRSSRSRYLLRLFCSLAQRQERCWLISCAPSSLSVFVITGEASGLPLSSRRGMTC